MVRITIKYRTKDFQNSIYEKCSPLQNVYIGYTAHIMVHMCYSVMDISIEKWSFPMSS